MKKLIITESQYKLLHEIDFEDTFSDVNASCVPIDKIVDELNNELNKYLIDKNMLLFDLGISVDVITLSKSEENIFGTKKGVIITSIEPNTIMGKTNIKNGFIVIAVNDSLTKTVNQLIDSIMEAELSVKFKGFYKDNNEILTYSIVKPPKKTKIFQPFHSEKSRGRLTKNDSEVDIEKYIKAITGIPDTIFDISPKMEKSDNGGTQLAINTGLPALYALVYDKDKEKFYKVNTCPKAGECRNYCYARGGQYLMNDGKILKLLQRVNLLLNEPEIYYQKTLRELELHAFKAKLDSIKLVIRWNDAGDFFSKKYLRMAKDATEELLKKGYDVLSYAYTKDAEAYLAGNENFVMNFSKGAKKSEQDKIDFEKTKYSEVVPKEEVNTKIWSDIFVKPKDAKYDINNETGLPEFKPVGDPDLPIGGEAELKRRIAQKYSISVDRLIFQKDLPKKLGNEFQYDVIVYPTGDSDIGAQRWDVQRTFLLIH